MTNVQARTPSGFNEYLPAEQIEFNRLVSIVKNTYEKYGFAPIDTPDLELSEVLLAKGGGETEQQVYRFTRGKNDLTMRYDLTVPLARYVAEHESELSFPFRRYQIGKVHRAERAQKGRFREFYQADIDIIGSNSPLIDAEIPAIINEIFSEFNFGEFTIRINNRMILGGFFEGIGISEKTTDVLRIVDKMEKISSDEFTSELKKLDLSDEQIVRINEFTSLSGSNDDILNTLESYKIDVPSFNEGVKKLRILIDALRTMQVPESGFKIDLKIARGLDYYTGTVYETILNDYPEVGSVCSGGRYDDLASYYTKTKLPGIGISIGLTRLFSKLKEIPDLMNFSLQSPSRIVIIPIGDTQNTYALSIAASLRKLNISTVVYSEPDALKKKLRFADNMGFRYVILIGDKELEDNTITLKDMQTGNSHTGPADGLFDFLTTAQNAS